MTQLELLQWLELINIRQAKNDFNVVDIPMSVLLELHRRRFTSNNVITDEGIRFLEKHKVEQ
jgi:hypothetical protein